MMDSLTLPALTRASGTVRLPGSKSISNRMLLLAALALGSTEIRDLLDSDDTRVMLDALQKIGVGVTALAATPGVLRAVAVHSRSRMATCSWATPAPRSGP